MKKVNRPTRLNTLRTLALLRAMGAVEWCLALAKQYRVQAARALDVLPASGARDELRRQVAG